MKKTILFIASALISFSIHSQSETESSYFNEAYNDTFNNSSIVIVRMLEEFVVTPIGMYDYKTSAVYRIQYKLKDQSALEVFSTMTKRKSMKRYELKQIKPNGKVNVIYEYFDKRYPDDGYEDDDEDENKKKEELIPVEDLEIGDIIDFKFEFTYTTKIRDPKEIRLNNAKLENEKVMVQNHNQMRFLRYENMYLADNYPIASQLIVYQLPEDLKINQRTFNTDFKFKLKAGSKNTYECRINSVPAYISYDFSYNLTHSPVIRYAVVQTNSSKKMFYRYQFESEDVSRDDIVSLGRSLFKDPSYISHFLVYKRVGDKPEDSYSHLEAFADMELDKFFKSFISTFCKKDKSKLESLNKMHEYLTNEDELNEMPYSDMAYAVVLGRFCKKLGLDFKMMAAMHKYDGEWKEVISPYDITWGLYVNHDNQELYITNYDKKSNIYRKFGSLSGTDVILFNPLTIETYETRQYPNIESSENKYTMISELKLSENKEYDYDIVNAYTLGGYFKYSINDIIGGQFYNERLRTPYNFFGVIDYNETYSWKEFDSQEQWVNEYARLDSFWRQYYKTYYKGQMEYFIYKEYKFDQIEVDSSVIDNDGEFEDIDNIDYGFKVYYKAKGILEETDSDSMLIMNLGRLISSQYNISNYKINDRKIGIYNSNLREISYELAIEIPSGYKPLNLEDFNVTADNEAGLFKAVATLEDGKIILKITKVYKTRYLPVEKWNLMVDYLHTAESYYYKKLLLSKQ